MAQIIHLKFKAVAERRLRYSVISKPRRRTCIQLWHRSILDDKSFLILYLPLLQRLPVLRPPPPGRMLWEGGLEASEETTLGPPVCSDASLAVDGRHNSLHSAE